MTHPVDLHVGRRIRYLRWVAGKTQQQLGDAVGIKFQQIQKYETGANRVSASRLYDISIALDAEISFFFSELDAKPKSPAVDQITNDDDSTEDTSKLGERFTEKEALDFLRHYYSLGEDQRQKLFNLTKSIARAA